MSNRILLGLALIAVSVISALGQTVSNMPIPAQYSESPPYVPRVILENKKSSDKKIDKKKEKKIESAAPVSVPISPETTTTNSFVVPVSVFDLRGALIKDVRPNEFQVFLNDAEADIVSVERTTAPRNVILLVDVSPSLYAKWRDDKRLLESVVRSFDISDKIMVAQFSQEFMVLNELTTDRRLIEKSLKRLRTGDGTSIYDAIGKVARESVSILPGQTILIVVTDGVDTTSNKEDFATSLRSVENTNTTVFPIYVDTFKAGSTSLRNTSSLPPEVRQQIERMLASRTAPSGGNTEQAYEVGRLYLNDLARLSGGRAISLENPLHASMPAIGEQLRNEYVLTVKPRSPMRIGERATLKVRVGRPDLAVMARGSVIPH